ncbi:hypothetical protein B4O97_05520 [Marispirochaeta aestuarii]|uniref:Uncharacterized protein n=2 Tax=Marispirochaeta aestuarii TaxID=1963862 RepID=A0A1Y1S055_9SPIO|nr:hypothetical protein B4O97_05520 [Marispirochaeta aestuarii]
MNFARDVSMMCTVDTTVNTIPVRYTDSRINEMIRSLSSESLVLPQHFNQNEEFFLKLPEEIEVPGIPIHHDIRRSTPKEEYLAPVRQVIEALLPLIPGFFHETSYYFDASEVLRPCFFQVFRLNKLSFLYLGRLDLSFRTHDGEMIDHGGNDRTPRYRTRNIYLDCDLIPLDEILLDERRVTGFIVRQIISQTWIGETGRGYFVQGIWIDHELTKFFSRLFIPRETSLYPYYPFTCKYRSLCHALLDPDPEGRRRGVPRLKRALEFIEPEIEEIQNHLKKESFSPELPIFTSLKERIPPVWNGLWKEIRFKRYLNEHDMKEFVLESAT